MFNKNLLVYWLTHTSFVSGILPNRTNRLEDVYLQFYNGTTTKEYVAIPLSQMTRLNEIKEFKKDNPTVFYVHGFRESPYTKSVQVMVLAYLEAKPDTNVIVLDWSNMALGSYLFNAGKNVEKVGAAAAKQLNRLLETGIKLENLHVIGHSLGCHVTGYIARELKNKYHKTVKRLTALDPSVITFFPKFVLDHVYAQDAEFVEVIHTDAGSYGTTARTGTAKFFPNGGKSPQPGCPRSPRFALLPITEYKLSNHSRSWWFYAESVRNPEAFPASPAASYRKFKENPTPEVGMVYMGIACDTSARGSYYLMTNSQTPFGKGMDGIYSSGVLPKITKSLEDVSLRFYNGSTTMEYVTIPLSQMASLYEIKGFKKDNPTVIYVHGFRESPQTQSIQVIVLAYLEAKPDTNVLVLDWSKMSLGSYVFNAGKNVKKVGTAAAKQLNRLLETGIKQENLHIIGHSLGGHVAGYIARNLKNKYHKPINRVTALDPAVVVFFPDVVLDHVDAKVAEFVDVIHTDAGGYGTAAQTGTADFFPNGGKVTQPGCPQSKRFALLPITEDNLCSHNRAWWFYAESVRNPEAFPASPAESYHKFQENPTPEVGMVYMGISCDTSARGSYYLMTNSQMPFGKGIDGIYSSNKIQEKYIRTDKYL